MARKPQASLCQAFWLANQIELSALGEYNNTCKVLEISDIIKGIRGKRDSNNVAHGVPESKSRFDSGDGRVRLPLGWLMKLSLYGVVDEQVESPPFQGGV